MIGVGIVGYGYAGRCFHSYLVPLADGLRLEAIASSDPAKRARITADVGCRAVATPQELFADPAVDLVVLATPHDTHASLTIAALEAGKHVVTDKAMCLTVAEADAMIAASRRADRLFSVFHNRRWDWDYLTLRQALAAGLLGQPYLFESAVLTHGSPRGWRADERQRGGVMYDWGAHLLDQALQLVAGAVGSVRYEEARVRPEARAEGGVADYGCMGLRFEDGTLFEIACGALAAQPKPRWYVLGDRGALTKEGVDPQEKAMLQRQILAAREDPAQRARVRTQLAGSAADLVLESVRGRWTAYYQNISDVLHGKAELAVTPESVRRQIAVLEAAGQALVAGGSVSVRI